MSNTLVTPSELSGFPGAPFTDQVVDAAVGNLRSATQWHIAPSITETLTLDCDGGTRLILPTLHLTAVSAVRDVSGDGPVAVTDFKWSRAGILYRACGWPTGFQSVEVDITHGHEACPPELLPTLAGLAQSSAINWNLKSKATGPFSEAYRDGSSVVDPAVARYSLPPRP